jgi:hypothetical protein
MILLIWPSDKSRDCAKAIEDAFQQPVQVVSSLEQGCEALQSGGFSTVLIDHALCEVAPAKSDYLFQHLAGAVPVTINFGVSGIGRLGRTLRAALEHRKRETHIARQNARATLRAELKDDVTALLLSCGIALQEPSLTDEALDRIRKIEEIANEIRQKLLASEVSSAAHA